MPMSLTNKTISFAPHFFGAGESTAQQYVGSGTNTSTTLLGPYFEFTDYTTTGSIPGTTQIIAGGPGDFGAARLAFRAYASFKAYTIGTASSTGAAGGVQGPLMTLEVATSTGFFPLYTLDWTFLPSALGTSTALNATSTGSANVGGPGKLLFGIVPVTGGAQFGRINFYANAGAASLASSTGIDAIIQAF